MLADCAFKYFDYHTSFFATEEAQKFTNEKNEFKGAAIAYLKQGGKVEDLVLAIQKETPGTYDVKRLTKKLKRFDKKHGIKVQENFSPEKKLGAAVLKYTSQGGDLTSSVLGLGKQLSATYNTILTMQFPVIQGKDEGQLIDYSKFHQEAKKKGFGKELKKIAGEVEPKTQEAYLQKIESVTSELRAAGLNDEKTLGKVATIFRKVAKKNDVQLAKVRN